MDRENRIVYFAIKTDESNFDHVAETSKMEGDIFTIVHQPASYPGGISEFYKYVGEEMIYPQEARDKNIEGRVYVQFVIETDGAVSQVTTVKGIGHGCDKEAERVLLASNDFIPAEHNENPVRQRMVIPIIFKMDAPDRDVIIINELEKVDQK